MVYDIKLNLKYLHLLMEQHQSSRLPIMVLTMKAQQPDILNFKSILC